MTPYIFIFNKNMNHLLDMLRNEDFIIPCNNSIKYQRFIITHGIWWDIHISLWQIITWDFGQIAEGYWFATASDTVVLSVYELFQ